MGPESDIISDIITIRIQLNLTLRMIHVHSHQNLKPGDPIPLEVQLNEGCVTYDRDFCITTDTSWNMPPTATPSPSAPTSLTISNKLITNNYRSRLTNV